MPFLSTSITNHLLADPTR